MRVIKVTTELANDVNGASTMSVNRIIADEVSGEVLFVTVIAIEKKQTDA